MTLTHDIAVDDEQPDTSGRERSTDGTKARTTRSRAAQRAIARREKRREREARVNRVAERTEARSTTRPRPSVPLRARITGVPFVVPVIALLVVGLGLSLWLSTKAAADSYKLGVERQENQALVDRRDSLKRTYESGNSAPELSDKASQLGMIPAQNPARMVVDGPGKPRIIGEPEPAQGRALRSINPPTQPDPVETIDPEKVDDSQGLPGTATDSDDSDGADDSGRATDTGGAAETTEPDDAQTPDAAPGPAQANGGQGQANPAPGSTRPTPPAVAPAPNVLPPNGNAPSSNSAESR
ncbi:hypothetical protein VZC37_19030 [Gordonia sp. LSe1-13]|uniref:Cell division protein FtsL n=1 Tax=Gordonia sesuvii TaxID=3116777 RepID=A0ABU7MHD3_9ACTN|nr:hypothetical protein [Gordonia sp. LSe1-13]